MPRSVQLASRIVQSILICLFLGSLVAPPLAVAGSRSFTPTIISGAAEGEGNSTASPNATDAITPAPTPLPTASPNNCTVAITVAPSVIGDDNLRSDDIELILNITSGTGQFAAPTAATAPLNISVHVVPSDYNDFVTVRAVSVVSETKLRVVLAKSTQLLLAKDALLWLGIRTTFFDCEPSSSGVVWRMVTLRAAAREELESTALAMTAVAGTVVAAQLVGGVFGVNAGPAAQSVILYGQMQCAPAADREIFSTALRTIAPAFLDPTPAQILVTNCVLMIFAVGINLSAVIITKQRDTRWTKAMPTGFFPSWAIGVHTLLVAGMAFGGFRLLFDWESKALVAVGIVGLLVFVLLIPIWVMLFIMRQTDRRYHDYTYHPMLTSRWQRFIHPQGRWTPLSYRRMFSTVLDIRQERNLFFILQPWITTTITALVASIPADWVDSGCTYLLGFLAALYWSVAIMTFARGPLRSTAMNVMGVTIAASMAAMALSLTSSDIRAGSAFRFTAVILVTVTLLRVIYGVWLHVVESSGKLEEEAVKVRIAARRASMNSNLEEAILEAMLQPETESEVKMAVEAVQQKLNRSSESRFDAAAKSVSYDGDNEPATFKRKRSTSMRVNPSCDSLPTDIPSPPSEPASVSAKVVSASRELQLQETEEALTKFFGEVEAEKEPETQEEYLIPPPAKATGAPVRIRDLGVRSAHRRAPMSLSREDAFSPSIGSASPSPRRQQKKEVKAAQEDAVEMEWISSPWTANVADLDPLADVLGPLQSSEEEDPLLQLERAGAAAEASTEEGASHSLWAEVVQDSEKRGKEFKSPARGIFVSYSKAASASAAGSPRGRGGGGGDVFLEVQVDDSKEGRQWAESREERLANTGDIWDMS